MYATRRRRRTRAEQVEETHQRLVEAGRETFLSEGFHGASLDKVAHVAGYTKGAVYSRFEDKADLFLAVLANSARRRIADIEALVTSGANDLDLGAALLEGWEQMLRNESDWFLLTAEFRIHAARNPAISRRYRAEHARLVEALATALARLDPAPDDPHALARIAIALATGIAVMGVSEDDLGPTEGRQALRALLGGAAM